MNRVAVITGGAQGLGAAAARQFLREDFAGIVLIDRDADGLAKAADRLAARNKVVTLAADLTDDETPARAIALAKEKFGRIDVLINAAGNTERCGIEDTTPAAYQRLFDVNVKAPLFMMQAAIQVMKQNHSGVIINVASMLAHGGLPNLSTYSASKGALVTLTKGVANTVKRDGIRAFVINLGWAATDGEHKLQTGFHGQPQDWAEKIGKRMPFGRLITSEDVAGVMSFLISPPAQMMTGVVIDYEQMPTGVMDTHSALAPE